jgi:hypothetical protein
MPKSQKPQLKSEREPDFFRGFILSFGFPFSDLSDLGFRIFAPPPLTSCAAPLDVRGSFDSRMIHELPLVVSFGAIP